MPDALRITTFTLTSADALAYEQASGRMTPLGLLVLLLWLGACGIGALLIPPDWAGARLGWASSMLVSISLAVGYVLALLVIAVRQWWRSRRRVPRPVEVTLTEWPDRLELNGGGFPQTVAFKTIRESRLTPTHLLLTTDDSTVFLPRRAFSEDEAIDGLAARIAGRPAPGRPTPPAPRPFT